MMHASLQRLFDQIESQRDSTLMPFRDFPADLFTLSPRPGKWSAAQVLSHVLTAERLSVSYMTKKVAGIDQAPSSGVWEAVKVGIFIASQRIPGLKFRAPKRVVENTPAMINVDEIEKSWNATRSELRALLDTIPEHQLNRKIYKHPYIGYVNVRQALIFFREHLIHHTPQLQKLLHQSNQPV